MRDAGELEGVWRDLATPPPVRAERNGLVDANAFYGIAVGCLLSLPLWVVIGAVLRVTLD